MRGKTLYISFFFNFIGLLPAPSDIFSAILLELGYKYLVGRVRLLSKALQMI